MIVILSRNEQIYFLKLTILFAVVHKVMVIQAEMGQLYFLKLTILLAVKKKTRTELREQIIITGNYQT